MQHLRIVGVNDEENVPQLILSDDSGQEFALPVDEALRHAATRPPARPSKSSSGTSPLTPREIQARLRAGATVDQVVAASGLTTAHVDRYAGPVHAERAYNAQRARATQVAPASAGEAHRMAFGDGPASLEAMVKVRLRSMDVDLSTVSWDSWRRDDGLWQISCHFDVDSSATHGDGIGLRPPAEWTFQPETSHLRAANRWAESLSALSAAAPAGAHSGTQTQSSAGGGRRLSAVDSVFDVEDSAEPRSGRTASGAGAAARSTPAAAPGATSGATPGAAGRRQPDARGAGSRAPRTGSPHRPETGPRSEGHEHEDLLDVLRARRGQRLGADAEADDRLALMLNRQDPQDAGTAGPADRDAADQDAAGRDAANWDAASHDPASQDIDEHSTVPLPRLRPVQSPPASEDEKASPRRSPDPSADEATGDSAQDSAHTTGRAPEVDAAQTTADEPAAPSDEGLTDGRLDAWGFAYEGESEERSGAAARTPTASAAQPEPAGPEPTEPEQGEQSPPERREPEPTGTTPTEPEAPEPDRAAEKPRKRAPARRPNMPKWDDILFGSKNE